jgi:hypothetical protein
VKSDEINNGKPFPKPEPDQYQPDDYDDLIDEEEEPILVWKQGNPLPPEVYDDYIFVMFDGEPIQCLVKDDDGVIQFNLYDEQELMALAQQEKERLDAGGMPIYQLVNPIDFGYEAPKGGWTPEEIEFLQGLEETLQTYESPNAIFPFMNKLAAWEWHRLPAETKRFYIHNPDKLVKYGKRQGLIRGYTVGYWTPIVMQKLAQYIRGAIQ